MAQKALSLSKGSWWRLIQSRMGEMSQSKQQMQDREVSELGRMSFERKREISLTSCLHDPCQPVSAPVSCPVPTTELSFATPPSKVWSQNKLICFDLRDSKIQFYQGCSEVWVGSKCCTSLRLCCGGQKYGALPWGTYTPDIPNGCYSYKQLWLPPPPSALTDSVEYYLPLDQLDGNRFKVIFWSLLYAIVLFQLYNNWDRKCAIVCTVMKHWTHGNLISVSWTVAVISFALEFLSYSHDKGLRLSFLILRMH